MTGTRKILPTKHLLFHAWMIVFGGATCAWVSTNNNKMPALVTFAYVILSVALYWLNELVVIPGMALPRLWKAHVVDPRVNRISIAIFVRIIELGYVLLMFFGWFLFAGSILFQLTGSDSSRTWVNSVLHIVHSAGIQTNRTFYASGDIGVLLTVLSSFAGLIFAALWVAIFMSDFSIIFGKDEAERARRLKIVTSRHRTSGLRRTRRSKS